MGRILRCVGLALAVAVLPAAPAQDKKPDPDKPMKEDKDKPKDKKEAVEKMHVAGKVTGKLTAWGSSDKGFTVQVPLVYYVLNDNEYRYLIQDQAKLATMDPRDVAGRINTMKAIAGHQERLYTEKRENVSIDFVPSAEMKVRTLHPMVYDDKGKPKKLTRKELDELKGPDKKLDGYTADASDIKTDMIVTVYIEKKKPTRTKSKEDKDLTDTKPEALMLLIVADAAPQGK